MKVVFLSISGGRLPVWLDGLCRDYSKRITHWTPMDLVLLKGTSRDRDSQAVKVKEDSSAILDFIKDDDFVLLFDERGKSTTSTSFAAHVDRCLNSGKKKMVAVIGGAYGVSDEVRERANLCLRLSDLTLNHHLALLVAHEQVYRAFTIIKGLPYHNA